TFRPATTPLYSCTTGQLFPTDPLAIRHMTTDHWASPVEFTRTTENMYADGVRQFVEAGPRANLSAFVEDIHRGRTFPALPENSWRRSGVTQFNHLAGQLAAHHVPVRLEYFYSRRQPRALEWEPSKAPANSSLPADNPLLKEPA